MAYTPLGHIGKADVGVCSVRRDDGGERHCATQSARRIEHFHVCLAAFRRTVVYDKVAFGGDANVPSVRLFAAAQPSMFVIPNTSSSPL